MRTLAVVAMAVGLTLGVVCEAAAIPGAGFSLGEGAVFGGDETVRSDVNAEAMLYMSFAVLTADLGLLMNLEKPDSDLTLRPGVRLQVPGLCYVRGAVPITLNENSDMGFLLGIGKPIVDLVAMRLFVELDATFMEAVNYTDVVPVEARLGLEIGF